MDTTTPNAPRYPMGDNPRMEVRIRRDRVHSEIALDL